MSDKAIKIALMSGAFYNAGDFLIVQRSKELLSHILPKCEITEYMRNISYDDKIDELNGYDAIVFAGGPLYKQNMYPNTIPFVKEYRLLKPKIVLLGCGWYGLDDDKRILKNYMFTPDTLEFLKYIDNNGLLSCRDKYSVQVLKNNGINNAVMTGCPAWYDLGNIDKTSFRKDIKQKIKNICVSDPARPWDIDQCEKLIDYLNGEFPDAKITVVFHRGIEENKWVSKDNAERYAELTRWLNENKIGYENIAGSFDDLKIYDQCDFHIGFRVHAHLYNLSKRNLTMLLEEDGRGNGANDSLGLSRIKTYSERYIPILNKTIIKENKELIKTIDNLIKEQYSTDFLDVEHSFALMNKTYYECMKPFIERIVK